MTGKEEQELYENICNDINCGTFILAPQYVNKLLAKLEKENAELNNRNQELLESCEGATMMYKQLIKAKEIIKDLMSFSVQLFDCRHTVDFEKTREQAEQFLKE